MKNLARIVVTLVVFLVVCWVGLASTVSAQSPEYWPTDGWRTSTPEEQGIDSEQLAKAFDFLQEADANIHSLLVIRNGYIVADAYFYPFSRGSRHDVASVTKSFTSTLVGIAIDKGHIESVDQPVLGFFPGRTVANLDANKKAMTLEHLLTMTSGLECINAPSEVTLFQMITSPDWVQFMLDLPMSDEPGTRFLYNSGGSHLLSAIIRETTGMNALAFAREHLFGPLGITDVDWPLDPQGVNNDGWGDLQVTPHDMAKLGYLYLNDGVWDGKQIVSSSWVAAATGKHVSTSRDVYDGYGYKWWIHSAGGYSAVGRGCQRIFVLPDSDMIVVVTSGAGSAQERKLETLLPSYIVPAVKPNTPLPANPGGLALLKSKINEAALDRDERKQVPPLPETARKVSGRTYVLDPNPYGLMELTLIFQKPDEALLRLSLSPAFSEIPNLELPVGLDNIYRIVPRCRLDLPAALKGSWQRDNVFVVNFNEIGGINNWRMSMAFEDDNVTVRMREMTGLAPAKFGGRLKR
jgi:CubicO group peptidase (beta-lactamase class C family)